MINLYDILKAANGQLFGEPAANLFTDFCLNPQQVGTNLLYVAVRDEQGDTHQYIEEAIKNGASGILCIDPPDCDTTGVSVLMVRDTIDALLEWSHHTLKKLNVKPIVVAGSSGKSVTIDAINRVLSTRYRVLRGDIDTRGRLSIPLSLAKLTSEHDYVVLKLDTSHPGEMAHMVEATQPSYAVMTHIDCVHSSAFTNCKQYIQEQSTLIEFLSPGSIAIINYDDDRTRELASRARNGVDVKTIGIDRFGADIWAFNVKVSTERVGFDLRYGDDRYLARWSPILGKHLLYSVLAAIALGLACQVPIEDALKALTKMEPLPGRMSSFTGKNNSLVIDDSYAATHASTMAAIDWLKEVRDESQRTFLVLGDIDDLGENARFGHRSVGQRVTEAVDVLITQGVEVALAGRAAIDSGKDPAMVRTTYSAQDAVAALLSYNLSDRDIVLVKGGKVSQMEAVVEALLAHEEDSVRLIRHSNYETERIKIPSLRPSWLEIDAQALASNVRLIKQHVGEDISIMAVVKSDGYGHGALMAARTALMNGADYLAVANMAEAVDIRDAGISAPILILTYAPIESVRQALRLNITVPVFDMEQARMYDRAARDLGGKLKYHLKIDTGLGRLGILSSEVVKQFRFLQTFKHIELEGVYTHFADAGDDPDYTADQVDEFQTVLRPLKAAGIRVKYIHAANSPAVLGEQGKIFNMVRPGLLLYGLKPHPDAQLFDGMRPVMSWKTTVIQVRTFPPGYPIGYGNTYHTKGEERIAILPVGYADGFRRSPQTWQYVLIHGKRAPIVGRVSMEKCAVNVTHIANVSAGDEVVLIGRQGEELITADMVADWLGTINYEVLTTILPRVPRT